MAVGWEKKSTGRGGGAGKIKWGGGVSSMDKRRYTGAGGWEKITKKRGSYTRSWTPPAIF
jgi:hypothetical protein